MMYQRFEIFCNFLFSVRLPASASHNIHQVWAKGSEKKSGVKDHEDDDSNIRKIVQDFSGRTTAHGVSYLIDSKSVIVRIFWILVVSTALGTTCYFGSSVVLHFIAWPYTTKVDLISQPRIEFPAVTICNLNRLRRSKLSGTRFKGIVELDGGLFGKDDDYAWFFEWIETDGSLAEDLPLDMLDEQNDSPEMANAGSVIEESQSSDLITDTRIKRNALGTPKASKSPSQKLHNFKKDNYKESFAHRNRQKRNVEDISAPGRFDSWWQDYSLSPDDFEYNLLHDWVNVTRENDWRGFYENSKADDFSDIIDAANPTKEELQDLGHQAKDFILQCTFDKRNCSYL